MSLVNIYACIRYFSIIAIAVAVSGCNSGSGSSSSVSDQTSVVIQGVVSDAPVDGATVTVMSLPNKEVLATTITNNFGAYSTSPISDTWLSNGYYITASGGISQGKPFVGQLSAVYGTNSDYSSSNVTILTTSVTKAAEANTSDLLQLPTMAQEVSEAAVSRGQLPTQWSDVDVATAYALDESGQILRLGVDGFTDELAFQYNLDLSTFQQDGTICVDRSEDERVCQVHVGSGGGVLRDETGFTQGNVIAEIPAPLNSSCEYDVNASIVKKDQSVSVWYQVAEASIWNSFVCRKNEFISDIVLQLPPPIVNSDDYLVPDEAPVHEGMPVTRTREALIESGIFVTDNETHRVKSPVHRTTSTTRMVSIERKYGANLRRKTANNSKHLDAASVLFIHGFTFGPDDSNDVIRGEYFGGGDGTWGELPKLVSKLNRTTDSECQDPAAGCFEPYNFQWRTDASFYDVAKDLAKAIKYAYMQSGNQKIHIIAHSFGGVLARVTLQDLYEGAGNDDWSKMVATLTTIGTPHSGTSGDDVRVEGIEMPAGWDSIVPLGACKQVSCYQTGLPYDIEQWMKTSNNLGSNTTRGYLIGDLNNNLSNLPDGLKIQVLVGQIFREYIDPNSLLPIGRFYEDGDELISFYGQRFIPAFSSNSPKDNLLYEARLGGAIVTERILGLNPKINDVGFPDKFTLDNLIDASQLSDYANQNSQAQYGYAHTRYPSNPFGHSAFEVNIPSDCNDPNTCEHDTWVNIRDLLQSMYKGPPSPNFENTTGLSTAAVNVSSVICSTPIVGETMTCTIQGSRLPELTQFTASNCSPSPMAAVVGGSGTQRQFTCTPSTVGLLVEVEYIVPGIIGPLPLVPTVVASDVTSYTVQPGPVEGKDIWTTSVFSYAGAGGGPGGGLDNEELRVGGWADYYYSLIQFDLTGLPTTASSARIELFAFDKSADRFPTGMWLDRITEFWDWRTQGTGIDYERLWWADRPSAEQWNEDVSQPLPAPALDQWYSIDVTNLYNAWQASGNGIENFGVQLRPVSNNQNQNYFYSSGYADNPTLRPRLVIVTGTPPNARPTASLEAIPSSIVIGESATLNWSSTNSSSCVGEGFSTADSTSGSVSASPAETTTYTLTCIGPGGIETATATVTVGSVQPNAGYVTFEEGNPGIEDDGVFVSSSVIDFTTFSFAADPKPFVGTLNDGVTITVITKLPKNNAYAQIYYEFGYLGTQCLVKVQDNNVVIPQKITAEATYYSPSVMSSITQAVRDGISTPGAMITSSLGCSGVDVSGMFFNRIELLSFGFVPIELDAVILDSGLVNR